MWQSAREHLIEQSVRSPSLDFKCYNDLSKFENAKILMFPSVILHKHCPNASYYYTGLFKMIVGVLTTCHTQYT